jgi:hypothetical protein
MRGDIGLSLSLPAGARLPTAQNMPIDLRSGRNSGGARYSQAARERDAAPFAAPPRGRDPPHHHHQPPVRQVTNRPLEYFRVSASGPARYGKASERDREENRPVGWRDFRTWQPGVAGACME